MLELNYSLNVFRQLSSADHVETSETLDERAFGGRAEKIPSLAALYAAYHAAAVYEGDVFKKVRSYLETQDARGFDQRRDGLFSGIGAQLSAAQHSGDEKVREAGRQLGHIYHNYQGAGGKADNKETAEIRNFVQDCRAAEMLPHLEVLPLVKADLADLEKANDAFDAAYDARSRKRQQELDKGTMAEARGKTDEAYQKLQVVINSLLLTETEPEQRALVGAIAEDVTAYMNQAKKGTRKKSGGDEPDPKPAVPELTVDAQRGAEAMPGAGFAFMDVFLVGADRKKLPALKEAIPGAKVRLAFEATGDKMEAPVVDFVYYEEQPAGFRLGQPDGTAYYADPLEFLDEKQYATAEMYASDEHTLLCRFKKMRYPSMVRVQ
jgi:hypothetical protein